MDRYNQWLTGWKERIDREQEIEREMNEQGHSTTRERCRKSRTTNHELNNQQVLQYGIG